MLKSKIIYLDSAASVSANPSSIHALGREAQKKLQDARGGVAEILGTRPEEIIFTSGGTESNNLAIQGLLLHESLFSSGPRISSKSVFGADFDPTPARPFRKETFIPHVVTTNIEHPSVLETCKMLQRRKLAQVTIVPVEPNGIVDPKKIKKALKKNTVLVSVMYANNEIGTIQPIREIAKIIRYYNKKYPYPTSPYSRGRSKEGVLFHTDAVQAANYLDLNVEKLGVDMLSLSGSKIEEAGRRFAGESFSHAQAGRVGVLYKRKSAPLSPVFGGGDQETRLRPGTENLPEILKFSAAFKSAQKIKEKETKRLTKLRNYFINKLCNSTILTNYRIVLNGDLKNRLQNNVNITFPKIPSDLMVIELSARGIMASSKSACKSGGSGGSYVIQAIRPEADEKIGGLRFSLGRRTTRRDVDDTVLVLSQILTKLKKWY